MPNPNTNLEDSPELIKLVEELEAQNVKPKASLDTADRELTKKFQL